MAYYNSGRGPPPWARPWSHMGGRGRGRFSSFHRPYSHYGNVPPPWHGTPHHQVFQDFTQQPVLTPPPALPAQLPVPAAVSHPLGNPTPTQVTVVREPIYVSRDTRPERYEDHLDVRPRPREDWRRDDRDDDRRLGDPRYPRSPDRGGRTGRGRGPLRHDAIGSSLQRIESRLTRIEQRKKRRHRSSSSSSDSPLQHRHSRAARQGKPDGNAAAPTEPPSPLPTAPRKDSKDVRLRGTRRDDNVGTAVPEVAAVPTGDATVTLTLSAE